MIKLDYDKQLHLWNIWMVDGAATLLLKTKQVSLRVACELIVDDPPHGYLVASGVVTGDGERAVIRKA